MPPTMAGKLRTCVLLLAITACMHVTADAEEVVVVKGEDAFATLIKARLVAAFQWSSVCTHACQLPTMDILQRVRYVTCSA